MAKTSLQCTQVEYPKAEYPEYPRTRQQRRAAYREIRASLRTSDPLEAITLCNDELSRMAGYSRRPCDAGNIGTWIPQFALNALISALSDAERRLIAGRQAVSHG